MVTTTIISLEKSKDEKENESKIPDGCTFSYSFQQNLLAGKVYVTGDRRDDFWFSLLNNHFLFSMFAAVPGHPITR